MIQGAPPPVPIMPGQQKKSGSLFGSKQQAPMPDVSGIRNDVGNMGRRLKVLEESFSNMRRQLQVTEQNMLVKNKNYSKDLKTLNSDLLEVKKELNDMNEHLIQLMGEVRLAAKRDDVKILERYINLWNPIKFATHGEVEDMVKEEVAKALKNSDISSKK